MARPKKLPPTRIDLTRYQQMPFAERDDIISVSDELKHGTPDEMRNNIGLMASMLESKNSLNEPYRAWLVEALREISAPGVDANKALGLKRKGPSPAYVKETYALAVDLTNQGMTETDAYDFLARYDDNRQVMGSVDGGAALKKKIERAYKRIFGSIPKTK